MFGALQVIGGVMLMVLRTRVPGAVVIAITFIISIHLLIVKGSWPFAIATLRMLVLLGSISAKICREAAHMKTTTSE